MTASAPRTLGVVMDPIAKIKPEKDTTLGLLEAAQRDGWSLVYFEPGDLYLRDGIARGYGCKLHVALDTRDWFRLESSRDLALAELDVMLMRKDPPIDIEFLYTCQMLEYAAAHGTLVVNDPRGIRLANEKILTQLFPDLTPPTLVSRNPQHILRFLEQHQDSVIKPLDNMGGAAVFRLRHGEQNTRVIIETSTRNGQQTVMVQSLIEAFAEGDKRILIIDGNPIAFALKRVPPPGELRANLVAGGHGEAVELDERDYAICARIKPELLKLNLLFVGIDVIGRYLTEINVSSPTCLRELNTACKLDIGAQLMSTIAERIARRQTQ